jgi:hypothetical protein
LYQIDILSNPIYECERDKFTQQSFHFLETSQKRAKLRLMAFQVQFNECERDKSLGNIFAFLGESEKSLNQTRLGVSRWQVTGEAKAPVLDFCGMSVWSPIMLRGKSLYR